MRLYPSLTTDAEIKILRDAGYTGSLNDMQFAFLRNQGMQGSISDMIKDSLDPEIGLSLTSELPPGSPILYNNLVRDAPAVFAADFEGLDGSAGGLIAGFGGAILGAYCGFRPNGDFVVRCGVGSSLPNDGSAALVLSDHPVRGNGTLVIAFDEPSPPGVSAWWNGQFLGRDTATLNQVAWAGTGVGAYLATEDDYPFGEVGWRVVDYTQASNVRHYQNQRPSV